MTKAQERGRQPPTDPPDPEPAHRLTPEKALRLLAAAGDRWAQESLRKRDQAGAFPASEERTDDMKPPGAMIADLSLEDMQQLMVKPHRRLLCCAPSPERDAVLRRIHEELDLWPTHYLIHLLPALAAHTRHTSSGQGDVSISIAGGSLWAKLRALDAEDGEDSDDDGADIG